MDSMRDTDTIRRIPIAALFSEMIDQNLSLEGRLSQQLNLLSDLSEQLTFKLLELEERLDGIESSLHFNHPTHSDCIDKLLQNSQERMSQLKEALVAPSKSS